MGRSRIIERKVAPLLRVPVYGVQYTISEVPDCVQDHLYALIDRNNTIQHACFRGFWTSTEGRCLRQKSTCYSNRLKIRHLRASWTNIAFNSSTSKIDVLCPEVLH